MKEDYEPDYLWDGWDKGMKQTFQLEMVAKDGHIIPVEISGRPIEYQGRPSSMAVVRDMTERKNTEHKIELNYQIQKAISSVLKISLEPLSLDEQLNRVLDLIITLPSFALRTRGSIYLVEHEPDRLVLRAMHGFSVSQVATCASVPLGTMRSVSAAPSTCRCWPTGRRW